LLYESLSIATISSTDPSVYFWVLPLDSDIGNCRFKGGNNPELHLKMQLAPRHAADNIASRLEEPISVRGLLEKYPTFGREKETGLLGALDT